VRAGIRTRRGREVEGIVEEGSAGIRAGHRSPEEGAGEEEVPKEEHSRSRRRHLRDSLDPGSRTCRQVMCEVDCGVDPWRV
jgi:hypothetical protein